MAKIKTKFVCQNCGYNTSKWQGKCPECQSWDSLVEEVEQAGKVTTGYLTASAAKPRKLVDVQVGSVERLPTGIAEFDRVLGGGIVPGSLVLLGGDPGVGKSTLVLDAGIKFSMAQKRVFYVSGEESEMQTKMRARRIGEAGAELFIMTETLLSNILLQAEQLQPQLLVIDSIQTMYNEEIVSSVGSVSQLRECTAKLLKFAKTSGIAVIIIGHVTKEGNIAGPKLLEHMVDVVLHFEGERSYSFRVLRALKNRFGTTDEAGIFAMTEQGLQEVPNPAALFLQERKHAVAGAVVTACLEGNRPLLVEFQALVAQTPFGMPRRTAVGFDYNRVNMLLAILDKRQGIDMGMQDAYINVVGGLKITETAADLAVIAALVSSFKNMEIAQDVLVLGEVGLTGEVRRVPHLGKRLKEAQAVGFKKFIIPAANLAEVVKMAGVFAVDNVEEALREIFPRKRS